MSAVRVPTVQAPSRSGQSFISFSLAMTWIPLSAFKINALAAYLHLSGAPHYDFVLHRVKGIRLKLSKSLRRQPIDEEQAQS